MASSINASTTAGVVTTADTSGVLNIQTAGTTAIAIDASQAVTMAGTLGVSGRISVSATNPSIRQTVQNSYLDLCGGTTVGTDPSIQIAGSTTVSDANTVFYNSNAHLFRTSSGGTIISRFNQYGLGLSTATPSSGVGITFPATQDASSNANTLDDYEEGTWTPTFGGSGSDPTGVSYSNQEGTYTKIGNRVFVEFFLSFTTFTGGSNAFYIRGLPFSGSGNGDGPMKIENVSLTAGKTYLVGTISASVISPNQVGSSTTWNGLTIGTNVTSSGTIKYFTGSLCYKI